MKWGDDGDSKCHVTHKIVTSSPLLVAGRKSHLWLIPCEIINHLITTSISISTINKWGKYQININEIISCCNILKE